MNKSRRGNVEHRWIRTAAWYRNEVLEWELLRENSACGSSISFPFVFTRGLRKVENCRSGRTVARALLARFNISSLLSSCTLAETRYPLPWKISIDPTKPRRKSIARRTARGNFLRKKKRKKEKKKKICSRLQKKGKRGREKISAFVKDSLTRSLLASGIISRGAGLRISDNGPSFSSSFVRPRLRYDPFSFFLPFSSFFHSPSLSFTIIVPEFFRRSLSLIPLPSFCPARNRTTFGRRWFPCSCERFAVVQESLCFSYTRKNDSSSVRQGRTIYSRCYFIVCLRSR